MVHVIRIEDLPVLPVDGAAGGAAMRKIISPESVGAKHVGERPMISRAALRPRLSNRMNSASSFTSWPAGRRSGWGTSAGRSARDTASTPIRARPAVSPIAGKRGFASCVS